MGWISLIIMAFLIGFMVYTLDIMNRVYQDVKYIKHQVEQKNIT
jgi:hypothetical protein